MLLLKHREAKAFPWASVLPPIPSRLGLLRADNQVTISHLPPKQRPVLSTTGAATVSATTQRRASTAAALWASCCSRTGRPAKVRVFRGQERKGKGLRLGPEIQYLLWDLLNPLETILIVNN